MNTLEKCQAAQRDLLLQTGESLLCGWKGAVEIHPDLPRDINLNELSFEELKLLDFPLWDENLYLIPLWIYPFLDKKIEVTCINGDKIALGAINLEHIYGCLAYGCLAYGIQEKNEAKQ